MTTIETTASAIGGGAAEQARDRLADRLVESATQTLEMFSIFIGREVGAYGALAAAGPAGLGVGELADRCAIHPRYAREWLEQQATAGLVEAQEGRFRLPAGHDDVLVDVDGGAYVAPLADMLAGISGVLHLLPGAYRTGGGVPYADYGPFFRRGQGALNRPAFADMPVWLATMPDVVARLDHPLARVADIGCGEGWSSIALARALPQARVHGYDLDEASVHAARRNAAASEVGDRVSVTMSDGLAGDSSYDLVFVFEALHDFARPVEVLRAARESLAEGGVVLVADERVADEFSGPGDLVERFMYGWSVSHCLPASMADAPSDGLGTVLRRETVHRLAREAGFSASSELPVDNDFFRFYRFDR
jgi:SAM-dependent methyltransferase